MAFVPKDGSGSLFKNTRKEKDSHPDYRGDLMIGGQLYEVAAWVKEGKSGKFFSLSAKPKQADGPREQRPPKESAPMPDDDIPF